MNRVLKELPPTVAVLMIGMVLGWWLAGSPVMWWIIVALALLAAGCRIAVVVRKQPREKATTSA